jgi:hypothetical protein
MPVGLLRVWPLVQFFSIGPSAHGAGATTRVYTRNLGGREVSLFPGLGGSLLGAIFLDSI